MPRRTSGPTRCSSSRAGAASAAPTCTSTWRARSSRRRPRTADRRDAAADARPRVLGASRRGRLAVENVAVGDRVAIMPLPTAASATSAVRGLATSAEDGLRRPELAGRRPRRATPCSRTIRPGALPDAVSDEQGALIEPAASRLRRRPGRRRARRPRARHRRRADRRADRLAAWRPAPARSSSPSPTPSARRWAEAMGIAAVFDPTADRLRRGARERTGGLGVDVAIECSGSEPGLQAGDRRLRTRGTIAQVGLHVKDAAIDPMRLSEHEIIRLGSIAASLTCRPTWATVPLVRTAPIAGLARCPSTRSATSTPRAAGALAQLLDEIGHRRGPARPPPTPRAWRWARPGRPRPRRPPARPARSARRSARRRETSARSPGAKRAPSHAVGGDPPRGQIHRALLGAGASGRRHAW